MRSLLNYPLDKRFKLDRVPLILRLSEMSLVTMIDEIDLSPCTHDINADISLSSVSPLSYITGQNSSTSLPF